LAGFSREPTGTRHTRQDWLAQFPPIDVAIQQFTMLIFLSSENYIRIGEYGSNFSGTVAEAPNPRFRRRPLGR
jgi:arachidonate 15-lipoxygenase